MMMMMMDVDAVAAQHQQAERLAHLQSSSKGEEGNA
jgi:hypothetical protein